MKGNIMDINLRADAPDQSDIIDPKKLSEDKGDKIGQGINNASTFLAENKKILEEIEGTLAET